VVKLCNEIFGGVKGGGGVVGCGEDAEGGGGMGIERVGGLGKEGDVEQINRGRGKGHGMGKRPWDGNAWE